MRVDRLIELTSILNRDGDKKISLKWDTTKDILIVFENETEKEIKSELINNLENVVNDLKSDMRIYNTIKDEVHKINKEIERVISMTENITYYKLKKKSAPLTPKEQQISYYHFIYTNDLGQGEGKLWPEMKVIPFSWIMERWDNIVKKYKDLGYDI
jgi:hypothetical protein